MHKLQEKFSLLVSLTSSPGALFSIFHRLFGHVRITLQQQKQLFACQFRKGV
jgi:hypothetical protein